MTGYQEAFNALIESFREKDMLLMVGAGSSKKLGMPTWSEILDILNDNLDERISKSEIVKDPKNSEDLMEFADKIKEQYIKENRSDDYFNTIKSTFSKKITPLLFHRSLVSVDWHGIMTTNYDLILEETLNSIHNRPFHGAFECSSFTQGELSMEDMTYSCKPLDMCDKQYNGEVLEYCRSRPPEKVRTVLHLHGCVNYPQGIILTNNDYQRAYGENVHSTVLTTLIVSRMMVFVGFSMDDTFFMGLVEKVGQQFRGEILGYAFLPIKVGEVPEDKYSQLEKYGIQPICFNVSENTNGEGKDNYSELDTLIFELEERTGTFNSRTDNTHVRKRRTPSIEDISRRMME